MVRKLYPLYILACTVIVIGDKVIFATNHNENDSIRMITMHKSPHAGTQISNLPSDSHRIQKSVNHQFSHCFHWRRRWYSWNVWPYYFWQGPRIYLHACRRDAADTWAITNDTPGVLVIRTSNSITEIHPGTTQKVPRHTRERFQIYSQYTGELKWVHTCVSALRISYYKTQDYLIVTHVTNSK